MPTVWDEIAADLREANPDESPLGEVHDTLADFGFAAEDGDSDAVNFVGEGGSIVAHPFSLADIAACRLTSSLGEGVLFLGVFFTADLWTTFEDRYRLGLERFVRAKKKEGLVDVPDTLDEIKDFLELGHSKKAKKEKKARKEEMDDAIDDVVKTLEKKRDKGDAPKGYVVNLEGPDGMGKSSTGRKVLKAFQKAGYETSTYAFKKPTEEEARHHASWRFLRDLPGEGEMRLFDRSQAGNTVYAPCTPEQFEEAVADFRAYEKEVYGRNILLVKALLRADKSQQMLTFGKRLARRHVAQEIMGTLEERDALTDESRQGLEHVVEIVGAHDLNKFEEYDRILAAFQRFTKPTGGWIGLDATNRHEARLKLLREVERAVRDYEPPS